MGRFFGFLATILLAIAAAPNTATADIFYDDGLTHLIWSGTPINTHIYVQDGPGDVPTTLEIIDGGSVVSGAF